MNYFYLSHWFIFSFVLLQWWLLQKFVRTESNYLKIQSIFLTAFSVSFVVLFADLPVVKYLILAVVLVGIGFWRRAWIVGLIFLNLLLFFYFKSLLGANELQYGLSYILFFSLSFLLCLRKENAKDVRQLHDFSSFVFFPPHILSGPFVTFDRITKKEAVVVDEGIQQRSFLLITWGLFVALIALSLEKWLNGYLHSLNRTNLYVLHLIMLKNFVFLYANFSSWSNIAIGVSGLMGFHFPLNFELPLLATNPSDFWRRWHVSLADFFSTYVYYPMLINLNRLTFLKSSPKGKIFISLFLTWMSIGIWHGFEWRYLFWSLMIPVSIYIFSLVPKTSNKLLLVVKWAVHTYFLIWITTLFLNGSEFFKNFIIKDDRPQSFEILFLTSLVIFLAAIIPTFGDWFLKRIGYSFRLSVVNFLIFSGFWIIIFLLIGNQGVPVYGKF